MIELPEARTLAKQLNAAIRGKVIASVEAAKSPHGFAFYTDDPADYPAKLEGKTVGEAISFAGQVEIAVEDLRLLFFDGANLRFYPTADKLPAKHQLCIGFDDGSFLVCAIQMYGGIQLFLAGANENFYYMVAKEKPDPLSAAFGLDHFLGIVREAKPNLSAKALLATEQRIPGLGNGCLQDILFRAGVNPQSKLSALGDGELERLFHCVRETLAAMIDGGGRDTEKDLYGSPGGYRSILSSKTYAYACPACGGGITRKAYLGGNVYFCAACQPIKK